jgi:hypothetical protein
MDSRIKAIETHYKGYRMRSRLEARWACFMDALGVHWQYEPEGFDLGADGWYLPDFYLPDQDVYVEIKPYRHYDASLPDESHWDRAFALSLQSGEHIRVVILCGDPGPVEQYSDDNSYNGFVFADYSYYWCECPDCGAVGIQFDGRSARNKHTKNCKAMTGDKGYNLDSPRITAAWQAARAARFDRNERG